MVFLVKPHIQSEDLDLHTGTCLRTGGLKQLIAQGNISSALCYFRSLLAVLTTFDTRSLTPALNVWPGKLLYGKLLTFLPRKQNIPEINAWLLALSCYSVFFFFSEEKYFILDRKQKKKSSHFYKKKYRFPSSEK